MSTRHVSVAAIAVLMPLSVPPPLAGQARLTGGVDAAFATAYVWRGITRSCGWVFQPDIVGGATWRSGNAVVGGWANLELYRPEPGADLTLGRRFGEFNAWGEYAWWSERFELALGYTRYWVDEDSAAAAGAAAYSTGEFYADLGLRLGPLVPRASLWVDVEEVKGAYIELDIAYRLPVFPLAVPSLYLGVSGGFSAGQAVNSQKPEQGAYFAENGLTHVDFWTYTQAYLPIGPLKDLYGTLEFHFQVSEDAATKRATADPADSGSDTKMWLSITLSWYN